MRLQLREIRDDEEENKNWNIWIWARVEWVRGKLKIIYYYLLLLLFGGWFVSELKEEQKTKNSNTGWWLLVKRVQELQKMCKREIASSQVHMEGKWMSTTERRCKNSLLSRACSLNKLYEPQSRSEVFFFKISTWVTRNQRRRRTLEIVKVLFTFMVHSTDQQDAKR